MVSSSNEACPAAAKESSSRLYVGTAEDWGQQTMIFRSSKIGTCHHHPWVGLPKCCHVLHIMVRCSNGRVGSVYVLHMIRRSLEAYRFFQS